MSDKKETALQIAMRITQRYANSLFDEHTQRGRQFMQEMTECLEQERDQIIDAYLQGSFNWERQGATQFYNETYGNKNENS
jgi:hypothetical protein